ncbi:MAG: hypothetical protein OXE73_15125 [Gammaproteobacteria bacterium]|nr:hypothetical protein [Gammaproteobacteria bacterium]
MDGVLEFLVGEIASFGFRWLGVAAMGVVAAWYFGRNHKKRLAAVERGLLRDIESVPKVRTTPAATPPTSRTEEPEAHSELALAVSLAIHDRNLLHRRIWGEERENVMDARSEAPFLTRFFDELARHNSIDTATEALREKGIGLPPGEEEAVELVRLLREGKVERARGRFPLRVERRFLLRGDETDP